MPPAKRTKPSNPSSAAALRPRPDWTWCTDISQNENENEITQEHLERALGLTSSRKCENKLRVALDLEKAREKERQQQQQEEQDQKEEEEPDIQLIEHPDDDTRPIPEPVQFKSRNVGTPLSIRGRKKATQGGGSRKRRKTSSEGSEGVENPACTAVWCRENLCCLNHLGAKQWLDPGAKKIFLKLRGLGADPGLDMRDPVLPVGLRNLGATCYANAFLQLWYRILPFRAAVYACAANPFMSSTSPCFQLALTFTGLQKSARAVFDPSGLVEALQLEKGDQQDASEFSKLFMALLQGEFSKNEDSKVKSVINDQFEGKLKYRTECMTCGYVSERPENFLELEISMEGTESSLVDRLQKSLEAETLDGDNQYHCSRCDKLRDAQRSVQIDSVPPTLNFSLLRFVFDPKTFDRKKSRTMIKFPSRINMRPYMSDNAGKDTWYELKGVIEHRGTSAHHGHFVAKVYDSEAKQWILCDDETTTKIRPMTALPMTQTNGTTSNDAIEIDDPIEDDNDDNEVMNPTKKSSPGNINGKGTADGRSKSHDDEIILVGDTRPRQKSMTAETPAQTHKSSQAYMLVYGLASDDDTEHNPALVPAKRTTDQIDAENLAWEADGEAFERKREALSAEFELVKQQKLEIMSSWDVEPNGDGRFVYTQALVDWVERGLADRSNLSPKKTRIRVDSPEDSEAEEAHVNGDSTGKSNDDPVSTDEKAAIPLEADKTRDTKMHEAPSGVPEVDMDRRSSESSNRTGDHSLSSSISAKKSDALRCSLSNKKIRCVHSVVNPMKGSDMRYISKAAHDRILGSGSTLDHQFARKDICRTCVEADCTRRSGNGVHFDATMDFKAARQTKPSTVEDSYLISSKWLKMWRRSDWKETKEEQGEDWWDECKAEIFCLHQAAKTSDQRKSNGEIVNAMAHAILVTDEPNAIAVPLSEECRTCDQLEEDMRTTRSEDVRQAESEQMLLKGVLKKQSENKIVLVDDVDNYIFPAVFYLDWLHYIRDPVYISRPVLTNAYFICAHQKLNVDFTYNPDLNEGSMYALLPAEWKRLQSLYAMPEDEIITVRPSRAWKFAAPPVVNKELCVPCWQERMTGDTDRIRLHYRLVEDDVSATGETAEQDPEGLEAEHDALDPDSNPRERSETRKSTTSNKLGIPAATRRSSRQITRSSRGKKETVMIRKDETVYNMKEEIEYLWKIPTFYQRVYHNGRELDDNKITISDAGLVFDTVVHVKDCSKGMSGDMSDVEHVPSTRKERAAGGFRNTLLHGLPVDESSGSEESPGATPDVEEMSVEEEETPDAKACPTCTFLNKPGFLVCEICGAQL